MTAVAQQPVTLDQPVTGRARLTSTLCLAGAAVGLGEVLVALSNARGRQDLAGAEGLYWLGLLMLFVPIGWAGWRLREHARALALLAPLLGLGVYLTRVLQSPTRLETVDELQTLRSLHDLNQSHHLFTINPIVPTYPRFPGSQIVIVTLHQLTGLSLPIAGKILIGTERVLLTLALFGLFRIVLKNPFAAFVAVLMYATNSSFAFFDSEVAYEAFALPLAAAALYLVAVAAQSRRGDARWLALCAGFIGLAVCVSHHMTSYWLAALLLLWSALALVGRRTRVITGPSYAPLALAVLLSTTAAAWFLFVAHAELAHELGPVFRSSRNAISSLLSGTSAPKRPFAATGAARTTDSTWSRVDGFAAVLVSVALMLAGLLRLRSARTRSPLSLTLLLLGAAYPLGLALRLTQASTETSRRTVEFAYVGAALAVGWLVALQRRRVTRPTARRGLGLGLALALGVLATGGVIVGVAPYDRFAGPYLVDADTRSVTKPGLQAASWAAQHWPAGASFTASDPTSALLVAAVGPFIPKSGLVDGVPVAYVFDSPSFDQQARHIIQVDKIHYLVVDVRVTTHPSPRLQWPLPDAAGPSTSLAATLPASYLTKLDSVAGLQREYDNGVVRIYRSADLVR